MLSDGLLSAPVGRAYKSDSKPCRLASSIYFAGEVDCMETFIKLVEALSMLILALSVLIVVARLFR